MHSQNLYSLHLTLLLNFLYPTTSARSTCFQRWQHLWSWRQQPDLGCFPRRRRRCWASWVWNRDHQWWCLCLCLRLFQQMNGFLRRLNVICGELSGIGGGFVVGYSCFFTPSGEANPRQHCCGSMWRRSVCVWFCWFYIRGGRQCVCFPRAHDFTPHLHPATPPIFVTNWAICNSHHPWEIILAMKRKMERIREWVGKTKSLVAGSTLMRLRWWERGSLKEK